jgi:hypothetical protein
LIVDFRIELTPPFVCKARRQTTPSVGVPSTDQILGSRTQLDFLKMRFEVGGRLLKKPTALATSQNETAAARKVSAPHLSFFLLIQNNKPPMQLVSDAI